MDALIANYASQDDFHKLVSIQQLSQEILEVCKSKDIQHVIQGKHCHC